MRAYTPAPWGLHKMSEGNKPFVVAPGEGAEPWVAFGLTLGAAADVRIAEVIMQTGVRGYPAVNNERECRANFQLISTAPELLEALESAVDDLIHFGAGESSYAVNSLRRVIAKAKGE